MWPGHALESYGTFPFPNDFVHPLSLVARSFHVLTSPVGRRNGPRGLPRSTGPAPLFRFRCDTVYVPLAERLITQFPHCPNWESAAAAHGRCASARVTHYARVLEQPHSTTLGAVAALLTALHRSDPYRLSRFPSAHVDRYFWNAYPDRPDGPSVPQVATPSVAGIVIPVTRHVGELEILEPRAVRAEGGCEALLKVG